MSLLPGSLQVTLSHFVCQTPPARLKRHFQGHTETSFPAGQFARSARLAPPVARQDGITAIPLGVARGNHGTSHPFDPRTAPPGLQGYCDDEGCPWGPTGYPINLGGGGFESGAEVSHGCGLWGVLIPQQYNSDVLGRPNPAPVPTKHTSIQY